MYDKLESYIKENYTTVFKHGYNIQTGVSDGFIRNIYVSNDGNDLKTYIPFMEKYKKVMKQKVLLDILKRIQDMIEYNREDNLV